MQIHKAAAKGDQSAVLRELQSGVSVEARDEQNLTPLMSAVSSPESNLETVRLLLENGASPNATGGEMDHPVLALSVKLGDLSRIELLLDAGADIAVTGEGGYDVLIWAVHGNDEHLLEVIDFLIERGAPLRGESDWSESALSVSSDNGHFDVVKRLLDAGADETRLEWTPLLRAVALGTLEEVRSLVNQGANLSDRDRWSRTPWLLSLSVGDIEKAKLLLEAGADRSDVGHCGKTPLIYPIETNNPEMLRWLLEIGFNPNATNEFGDTALIEAVQRGSISFVRLLLDKGAELHKTDKYGQRLIAHAGSMEMVRLLLAEGEDLNDLSAETRAVLLGIEEDGELLCSREEFEAGRTRRFGTANPEKMDVPFWQAMIRSGATAYAARHLFLPEDDVFGGDEQRQPIWCYHRFGKSLTELPDGRFIEVGGEHEDSYDRDFCIYNEVFVHHPGGEIDIYSYPAEVFPTTDFHTATLVGDTIYIIGCMGYPEQRVVGYTPVYRLNTETFAIEKIETGGENPGWLSRHKATLNGNEIHIFGGQTWQQEQADAYANYLAEQELENEQELDNEQKEETETEPIEELPESLLSGDDFPFDIEAMLQESEAEIQAETERERTQRFALNLTTLRWRRLTD